MNSSSYFKEKPANCAPAYEEAGDGFVVLVDGSVEQRLLAATRSGQPQVDITAMLHLQTVTMLGSYTN